MDHEPVLLVFTTAPSAKDADSIASAVLEHRAAACVNIIPGMTSKYWWQGKLETAGECLLIIKTVQSFYPAVEAAIRSIHPYQTPEILGVAPEQGFGPYQDWIVSECRKD